MSLVGYKGSSEIDVAYFFCPYRPGMTDDEIAKVNEEIREASKPPTEIQQRIMDVVRNVQR